MNGHSSNVAGTGPTWDEGNIVGDGVVLMMVAEMIYSLSISSV